MLRTYAPVGQTPIICHKLGREHLSVISGVTPSGDLYLMVQDRAYKGPDVVDFLEHLLCQIPGKLLVIWDGAPIHRSKMVKEFLAEGAALRLHLEQLTPYAPDLNLDEGFGDISSTSSYLTAVASTWTTPMPSGNSWGPLTGSGLSQTYSRLASSKLAIYSCLFKAQ